LLAGLNCKSSEEERRLDVVDGDDQQHQQRLYIKDRRMHLARDMKLAYVHIPKTGGTTIEDSSLFDHKRKLGVLTPRSHFTVRTLKNASETDGFVVATHIRNPCDRFTSAFLYLRYDPRSTGMHKEAESLNVFKSETTEEFVDWLDATNSWDELKERIHHFQPMVHWLVHEDSKTFGVDVVMCQEKWEEGIKRLTDKLEINSIPTNLMDRKRANKAHTTTSCDGMDEKYASKIMSEYDLDACLFGYGKYDLELPDHNETVCIGAQHDRSWFSDRLAFCRAALGKA
jgi:hypothetical protein